jgi:hypothetical protein
MVYNREQAAKRAEASRTNVVGMCQNWTWNIFQSHSVGDVDKDGDADAVDGWKSEPKAKRHTDRHPPRGVPVAWSGGRNGHGHRAVSLGHGKIRSTDAGGPGRVATVDLDWPEKTWGLKYLGWSETISGIQIPVPKEPTVTGPKRTPPWMNRFKHLNPNHYMNYHQAVLHLVPGGRIDIDGHRSKQGTGWALHWRTVGKNHLHDPRGLIKPTRRIDSLTNAEIKRLRGPNGQQPFRIVHLLREVYARGASAEVELKVVFDVKEIKRWLADASVKALDKAGHLQFKTLASMAGAPGRLRPAHEAGGETILSFTKYSGAGIYRSRAWPVTTYYRGTPKWR